MVKTAITKPKKADAVMVPLLQRAKQLEAELQGAD